MMTLPFHGFSLSSKTLRSNGGGGEGDGAAPEEVLKMKEG